MTEPLRETNSPSAPLTLALIGGSGLGDMLNLHDTVTTREVDTPFGRPSGPILRTRLGGVDVLMLQRHGPGHVLNPSQVPYRANLFALKQLGATHILASGAVGSLREEFRPRDLVIVDGTIDKTHRRASTFFEHAAVHVEFSDPFCPVLRSLLLETAAEIAGPGDSGSEFRTHDGGTYVCMEGPQFSTRAESRMHRLWGGGVVGMTLMPEAKLAREAELPYAAVCLVTDYDSWKPHVDATGVPPDPFALLQEITGHLKAASANAMAVLKRAVEKIGQDPQRVGGCPASRALELGIWSDKSKIDPAEVQRLAPLWGKYFETGDA